MAVNIQFAIAVHIMAVLGGGGRHVTSASLAMSVNTSPSFVRRVLARLSKAGLAGTATGKGGTCWLARPAREISLLDIYKAVDAPKAFSIHAYAEQGCCAVSCHIKAALRKALAKTQRDLEASLDETSLAQVLNEIKKAGARPALERAK